MDSSTPSTAFHFKVAIGGAPAPAFIANFAEVSGLEPVTNTTDVLEGGETLFAHTLPRSPKYSNLILRRGVLSKTNDLIAWCKSTLEGGFPAPVLAKDITLALCDTQGAPIATWTCGRAYPVKWQVGPLNATANEIAIETMEFAYGSMTRNP